MSNTGNIWNNNNDAPGADELQAYLEGRLDAEHTRKVEEWLSEEGMESDAIEGMQSLSAKDSEQLTQRINYRLKHDIRKQTHRSNKMFADNKWSWLAVLIICLLVILAYFVMRNM